jgi:hypothetical protein
MKLPTLAIQSKQTMYRKYLEEVHKLRKVINQVILNKEVTSTCGVLSATDTELWVFIKV